MSNCSSQSSSSSESRKNVILMLQRDEDDGTIYGAPGALRLNRSSTVKRAGVKHSQSEVVEDRTPLSIKSEPIDLHPHPQRVRRSLDSTCRKSLEAISEYKTKHSFSTTCLFPSRGTSSRNSSISDYSDFRPTDPKENTLLTSSSSFLSWIGSVNSDTPATSRKSSSEIDVDSKVGEWNNFWLNYNSPHSHYLSSPYSSAYNYDKTDDGLSDCKSTCATHPEFTDKDISMEQIFISHEEAEEVLRYSQRITEIFQGILNRHEREVNKPRSNSYFSQLFPLLSNLGIRNEKPGPRERRAFSLQPQELQRLKQTDCKQNQSPASGNSINALFGKRVGDILRKAINKQRERLRSAETPSSARSSVSDKDDTK